MSGELKWKVSHLVGFPGSTHCKRYFILTSTRNYSYSYFLIFMRAVAKLTF